jgi:NAD(P)-dependent dehydrogenase (short-subunit alcohol dehydrogenase family)
MSLEEWEDTLRVDVTGTMLACRAFLPGMIARGSGSVVVIGSVPGERPLVNRTPCAASKTALVGLVRTPAWELGSSGVRVDLVSPSGRLVDADDVAHAVAFLASDRAAGVTGEDLNVSAGLVMC